MEGKKNVTKKKVNDLKKGNDSKKNTSNLKVKRDSKVKVEKSNIKSINTSSKKVKSLKNKKCYFNKIINRFFYILLGIILTCLIFYFLCGRRNYFKLYYELRELINVYDIVTTDYYGDLDSNELINSAIDSMLVDVGDSYTSYIDKGAADDFLENVNGTYEGIGCYIATDVDGNIIIIDVFEDSPSSKAGLKVNDILLRVDDEDFTDKTSLEISEYIKNSNASEFVLAIKRGEELLDIEIKREKIDIPVVKGDVLEYADKKIGYISVDVFSSVSYKQIKNKLKKLEKDGIDALVVDVRGNSGGYLSAVTDISSLFLKKGKVIYQLEGKNKKEKVKDSTKEYRDYPIAVLVNNGSASASEIFAAVIKESYGGYVVGTTTFGKGTVQKTKMLCDGGMIKYTVQKWLTPKGNFINEKGVEPTNFVELDYNLDHDNQLDEALKIITSVEKR